MTTSNNGVGAYNATVHTEEDPMVIFASARQIRNQRIADCDAAVAYIKRKLAVVCDAPSPDGATREQAALIEQRKAALHDALTAAEAEAEQARREAQQEGSE